MENIVLVRGAGDLASGIIHRLNKCGLNVLALEVERPLAIRRSVAFSEAVYDKEVTIEGVTCKLCNNTDEIISTLNNGNVALVIDPKGEYIEKLRPRVIVDSILAKKNLGTHKSMAKMTIGVGPGFCAGKDVDVVIETMRGHDLGRIITKGEALKNTGVPGSINGISKERVVYSKEEGKIKNLCKIGDVVNKGQIVGHIKSIDGKKYEVMASIDGILRGIIRDGSIVDKNLKILDIDPRLGERKNSFTISDKARCISGSVLEVIISSRVLSFE